MELYQLKSFSIIAETRNLTKAAERLNISQSALSTQIKTLEDELGLMLFARNSRGMELNDKGRVLLTHAQEILKACDEMRHKAGMLGDTLVGDITLGINTEPAFLKVSAISRLLSHDNPDINLILMACQSVDTVDMLKKGIIDAGFFYHHPQSDELEYVVLEDAEICITGRHEFIDKEAKYSWAEIAAKPWVWAGYGCPFYIAVSEIFEDKNLKIKQAINCEDEYVIRELVLEGHGLGMLRLERAREYEKDGRVVIWEEGIIPVKLCLGWLKSRSADPAINAVRTSALEVFVK
jgi:DNA-binding transcriptional LysR family regulator